MPVNILMPALSPTMEKGNLAKWLKKEGDKVKSGDIIAEIETDKATMEVEAVDEGTLAKIVVPEGTEDVAVNAVIAVLAGEGEDVKAAASAAGKVASAGTTSPQPSPQRGEGAGSARPQAPSPSPLPTGERSAPAGSAQTRGPTTGSGAGEADRATGSAQKTDGHARVFSSPLARRLAQEANPDT